MIHSILSDWSTDPVSAVRSTSTVISTCDLVLIHDPRIISLQWDLLQGPDESEASGDPRRQGGEHRPPGVCQGHRNQGDRGQASHAGRDLHLWPMRRRDVPTGQCHQSWRSHSWVWRTYIGCFCSIASQSLQKTRTLLLVSWCVTHFTAMQEL